jgi:hypothetical protein
MTNRRLALPKRLVNPRKSTLSPLQDCDDYQASKGGEVVIRTTRKQHKINLVNKAALIRRCLFPQGSDLNNPDFKSNALQ